MNRWTPEEDEVLATYARLGAKAVRRELRARTGYWRTEQAIVKRASRLGVSMETFEVCPECGAHVKKLGPKGMCRRCEVALAIAVERYVIEEIERGVPFDEDSRKTLQALRRKAERALRK